MRIAVPKEIKNHEYRVGLTPNSVRELTSRGHQVYIEQNAGSAIGYSDGIYREAGAEILNTAESIFEVGELIVKVKEPQPEECRFFRKGQVLFTFLHLAPDPKQADLLLASDCIAIAYETVTDEQGGLPLLTPMSEIAGRLSIQAGARCLEKIEGGRGILLGGVPGVPSAKVVILGGGVSGTQALKIALGIGAEVVVMDKSLKRLRELDTQFDGKIITCYSCKNSIEYYVSHADLVIGAILTPGAAAPKIVTRDIVKQMASGSVIVDISIDQGGCFETSRPTLHSKPTYIEEGVVHYCVTNMPGAVPRTSAVALNNATLPFVLLIAEQGIKNACVNNSHLLKGLNVCMGKITHEAVAKALNKPYIEPITAVSHLQ